MHVHNGGSAVPTILGYHRRCTTSALCVFDLEYVLCQSVQMKALSDMMHTVSPVMGGGHEVVVWKETGISSTRITRYQRGAKDVRRGYRDCG